MRRALVVPLLILAACGAAPRHHAELDTSSAPRAGAAGGGGAGAGGAPSVHAPFDAGLPATEPPPSPQASAEAPCDVLARCIAALGPLDPARDWYDQYLALGTPETCAAGVDDLVASGDCEP